MALINTVKFQQYKIIKFKHILGNILLHKWNDNTFKFTFKFLNLNWDNWVSLTEMSYDFLKY